LRSGIIDVGKSEGRDFMATITQELIHNVLGTKFEDFGSDVIQDAKNQLIDIVAVTVSGADGSGNSMLLDLVRAWGGHEEATILALGDRVPLPFAAMMNSVQCRSYDHEVVGPYPFGQNEGKFAGHVESTTVPCALTVAEYVGASGKDLLSAIVLGGDLAARVSIAQELSFDDPFDPVGTANAFGAAGLTGRLMGLNETQMMNAFGILTNLVAGGFRSLWDGVHTFKLYGATAAKNSIIAVQLASKGFTGLKDPLLGPQGYFACYCPSYHPEFLTRDLGKQFYVKGCHKKYPSCYGNHNVIDCALDIVQQHDINAEDIAEVIIGVAPRQVDSYLNQPFKMGDSQPKALFNYYYSAACALLRKGVRVEHYTEEAICAPEVVELAGRGKVVPTQQKNGATELKIKMKDGKEYSSVFKHPHMRGYPLYPLTKEELTEKYWNNVNYSRTVSKENAEKALDMLENLEKVDSISQIIKLLVA
jgi:2-methylcitrate dehydratase PrpD